MHWVKSYHEFKPQKGAKLNLKEIKRAEAHFKDFGGSRTRNRTNKRTADLSTCKSTGNASDEQRE
jgi:hypothetical protein